MRAKVRLFNEKNLSEANWVMGMTPDGVTRTSTDTSLGVTGITSSSMSCEE